MAQDTYEMVTNRIVEALKAGVAPWVRPWQAGRGRPHNGATGHVYQGVNMLLTLASGFQDTRWFTFNQLKAYGRSYVRKGQKATPITYWKFIEGKEKADGGSATRIPLLRTYSVFNFAQIEWEKGREPVSDATPCDPSVGFSKAADLLARSGAEIWFGSDVPHYRPSTDRIGMPHPASFNSPAEYHATLLHELAHWSGAPSRCARNLTGRFGSEAYAAEELVAELSAAFMCADLDIQGHLQHAEYIGNWIKVLSDDPKAIFSAARLAREAVAFLTTGKAEGEGENSDSEVAHAA